MPYAQRATKGFTLNKDSILEVEVPFPDKTIREKIVKEGDKREKEKENLLKKIEEVSNAKNEFIRNNTA